MAHALGKIIINTRTTAGFGSDYSRRRRSTASAMAQRGLTSKKITSRDFVKIFNSFDTDGEGHWLEQANRMHGMLKYNVQ